MVDSTRPDDGNVPDDLLDIALADYMQRIDASETVDQEQLFVRYPQVADQLREYFRQASAIGSAFEESIETDQSDELLGTEIGPYKLLQIIGEGGMGTVYLAEQEKPVQRRVALKVIKPGMDSKQIIARFEAERQAISMMDHPNIAHVLDTGSTESGSPFFVMELVKGLPITRYCDEKKLGIRKRLELFKSICDAVQHAHQKGILHRDLKPNNILVADYDNQPVAKIIDFGLAKALHHRLTDKTMFTQFGDVMGTLEYMSPEQSKMNQLDVDTRTDIYSLGVLLYELLTGTVPFDSKRLRSLAFDQVLKIIREEEPPKPSLRLSKIESSVQTAASRGTEPRKLNGIIRGDLDWIVMKSMEKDRSRRYETANAMAMDITRYLNAEPIAAAPPSARYRIRKFVRRNRAAVVSGSLVGVALLIGVVGTSYGLFRAQAAEADARAHADVARKQTHLVVSTLATVLSDVQQGLKDIPQGSETRRKLLSACMAALEQIELDYISQASVDETTSHVLLQLGDILMQFGAGDSSIEFGATVQSIDANQESTVDLATAYYKRANDIALEVYNSEPQSESHQQGLIASYQKFGDALWKLGKHGEALELFQACLSLLVPMADENADKPKYQRALSRSHEGAGDALIGLGRLDRGMDHYQESIRIRESSAQKNQIADLDSERDLLAIYSRMGNVYLRTGETTKARAAFEKTLAKAQLLVGQDPQSLLFRRDLYVAYYKIGTIHLEEGNVSMAIEAFQKHLNQTLNYTLSNDDDVRAKLDLGVAYRDLGNAWRRQGNLEKARGLFEKSLDVYEALTRADENDPRAKRGLSDTHESQGLLFYDSKNYEDAKNEFKKCLALRKKLVEYQTENESFQRALTVAHSRLGDTWMALDQPKKALVEYEYGLAIRQNFAADDNDMPAKKGLLFSYEKLGNAYRSMNSPIAAGKYYAQSITIGEELEMADPKNIDTKRILSIAYENYARLLESQNKLDEALELIQKALNISKHLAAVDEKDGQAQNDLVSSYYFTGQFQLKMNQFHAATQSFDAAATVLQKMIEHEILVDGSKSKLQTINGLSAKSRELAKEQIRQPTESDSAKVPAGCY